MNDVVELLRQDHGSHPLSYALFIQQALYHPISGYYQRAGRRRVAHAADADFYTAESLGLVFSRLAVAATWERSRAASGGALAFVEVGAEAGDGVTPMASPPFNSAHAVPVGNAFAPDGPCVVFCNELLDAQPFHRLRFRGGRWEELGVQVVGGGGDARLEEIALPEPTGAVAALLQDLPDQSEGYRLDLPLAAETLLAGIAANEHVRVIVAFDYGLDWDDLTLRRPGGTARTYHRQTMGTDLLANPGQQDITCHVCWDRLEAVLRDAGFGDVRLQRQESFFMHHARDEISHILQDGDIHAQSTLRELLHPLRMGAAFQVLSAVR